MPQFDAFLNAKTDLAGTPASGDKIPVIDVSDTSEDAGGTLKTVDVSDLLAGAGSFVWLGPNELAAQTGSPALSVVSGWPAWLLDSAATETLHTNLYLPDSWTAFDVEYWWSNAGAGSGNATIGINYRVVGDTESLGAGLNVTSSAVAAPAASVMKKSTVATDIAYTAGELLNLRVFRLGADAGDTLGNDIGLLGVRIVKS